MKLAAAARRVIVAKGSRVVQYVAPDTKSGACVDAMLGPTGNLRAPTLIVGDTVVVGFHDETYREFCGKGQR